MDITKNNTVIDLRDYVVRSFFWVFRSVHLQGLELTDETRKVGIYIDDNFPYILLDIGLDRFCVL